MRLVNAWYRGALWLYLLWPLSLVFRSAAALRRVWLQDGAAPLPLPVVVIGNITVGGTGKTPMVIALARLLVEQGLRPGVVSRGFRAGTREFPREVAADDDSDEVGDEALVLRRNIDCPLILDPDRPRAVRTLAARGDCDVIISDDGLQHYAMHRDLEIVMVDAARGLGNGLCLPAGPLREPARRLQEVDRVIINGGAPDSRAWLKRVPAERRGRLELRAAAWVSLRDGRTVAPDALPLRGQLHAIAGIGHPARFFDTVRQLGYSPQCHAFADHHRYGPQELSYGEAATVVMTEKDAVKCADMAPDNSWYLRLDPQIDAQSRDELLTEIRRLCI